MAEPGKKTPGNRGPENEYYRRNGIKHVKPRGKDKSGISKEQLKMLVQAWKWEYPDSHACDYAGVTLGKLKVFFRKHPEWREKRDNLKATGEMTVRKNLVESLKKGDMQTTKWFAERRMPEYQTKGQIEVNVTHSLDESAIVERLSRFMSDDALLAIEQQQDEDIIDMVPANGVPDTLEALLK